MKTHRTAIIAGEMPLQNRLSLGGNLRSRNTIAPHRTGHLSHLVFLTLTICSMFCLIPNCRSASYYSLPQSIQVLPVFLVPSDQANPTPDEKNRFMQHLLWAQARYLEMLSNRATFSLATNYPVVVPGQMTLAQYQQQPEGGAPTYVSELLNYFHYNRFNCPYIFAIILVNPQFDFPTGGGRTLNTGWNSGGGMLMLSSWNLDNATNFQSTLQHELGHSFGLPHVDVYGYSMDTNASIMSYNPAQHTSDFTPSPTPGILIPEDLRVLCGNKRAFPDFNFNASIDTPSGYNISPNYVWLGAQTIPSQTNYALQAVTTTGGDAYGTSPNAIILNHIEPSAGPGVNFDAANMWHSTDVSNGPDGWVSFDVTFPLAVSLDKIVVHSQHSGLYHMAHAIRVQKVTAGNYIDIYSNNLQQADQVVFLPETTSTIWRFYFYTTDYDITIRGLELFSGFDEIFPPAIPTFNNPATIDANPVAVLSQSGRNVTFNGHAVGSLPVRYRWQLNGTNITGGTNSTFPITNISTTNIGYYQLVVSNSVNTATSSPASLGLVNLSLTPARVPTLAIDGPVNANYRIDYKNDLTLNTWNLWTNANLSSSHFSSTDTSATNASARFYRVSPQ